MVVEDLLDILRNGFFTVTNVTVSIGAKTSTKRLIPVNIQVDPDGINDGVVEFYQYNYGWATHRKFYLNDIERIDIEYDAIECTNKTHIIIKEGVLPFSTICNRDYVSKLL